MYCEICPEVSWEEDGSTIRAGVWENPALPDGFRGPAGPPFLVRALKLHNQHLAAEGNGQARCRACTEGCLTPCAAYFQDMPGAVHNRKWSGSWCCVSALLFPGSDEDTPAARESIFDWQLERHAAFEMKVLSNRYGLNHFDILMGMVPWLIACQKAGLISVLNGQIMDWRSPAFWAEFLEAIAYRRGRPSLKERNVDLSFYEPLYPSIVLENNNYIIQGGGCR